MAIVLDELLVKLRVDTNTRGLSQLDKDMHRMQRRWNDWGQQLRVFMAVAVTGAVGGAFAATIKNASDLVESINAVEVVFEEAAYKILRFGETAGTSVGMATADFNQMVTVTGALMQQFGQSNEDAADTVLTITKRVSDMASVYNTTVKDALKAFNAALRGEHEPIRRYAVDVTDATLAQYALEQGITKSIFTMTQAEKGMLRYGVIMQQTAKTEGDFIRTQDELANRWRITRSELANVSATFGMVVIPQINKMLKGLLDWTAYIRETVKGQQDLKDVAGAVGSVLKVLGHTLNVLVWIVSRFANGLRVLKDNTWMLITPLLVLATTVLPLLISKMVMLLTTLRFSSIGAAIALVVLFATSLGWLNRTIGETPTKILMVIVTVIAVSVAIVKLVAVVKTMILVFTIAKTVFLAQGLASLTLVANLTRLNRVLVLLRITSASAIVQSRTYAALLFLNSLAVKGLTAATFLYNKVIAFLLATKRAYAAMVSFLTALTWANVKAVSTSTATTAANNVVTAAGTLVAKARNTVMVVATALTWANIKATVISTLATKAHNAVTIAATAIKSAYAATISYLTGVMWVNYAIVAIHTLAMEAYIALITTATFRTIAKAVAIGGLTVSIWANIAAITVHSWAIKAQNAAVVAATVLTSAYNAAMVRLILAYSTATAVIGGLTLAVWGKVAAIYASIKATVIANGQTVARMIAIGGLTAVIWANITAITVSTWTTKAHNAVTIAATALTSAYTTVIGGMLLAHSTATTAIGGLTLAIWAKIVAIYASIKATVIANSQTVARIIAIGGLTAVIWANIAAVTVSTWTTKAHNVAMVVATTLTSTYTTIIGGMLLAHSAATAVIGGLTLALWAKVVAIYASIKATVIANGQTVARAIAIGGLTAVIWANIAAVTVATWTTKAHNAAMIIATALTSAYTAVMTGLILAYSTATTVIGGLTLAVWGKVAAIYASVTAMSIATGRAIIQAVATGVLTVALIAQKVAQWAVNVATYAFPGTWILAIIIAVVAAIVAFVAGLVLLVKNWGTVKDAITNAVEGIISVLSNLWGWITDIFKTFNLFEYGRQMIMTFVDGVTSAAETVVQAFKDVLGPLADFLPSSDAKIGPLSELTKAGEAIPVTIIHGIEKTAPLFSDSLNKELKELTKVGEAIHIPVVQGVKEAEPLFTGAFGKELEKLTMPTYDIPALTSPQRVTTVNQGDTISSVSSGSQVSISSVNVTVPGDTWTNTVGTMAKPPTQHQLEEIIQKGITDALTQAALDGRSKVVR